MNNKHRFAQNAMLSIVLGTIFVVSCSSGRMTLLGTQGCQTMVYVGLGLIILGSAQIARRKLRHAPPTEVAA